MELIDHGVTEKEPELGLEELAPAGVAGLQWTGGTGRQDLVGYGERTVVEDTPRPEPEIADIGHLDRIVGTVSPIDHERQRRWPSDGVHTGEAELLEIELHLGPNHLAGRSCDRSPELVEAIAEGRRVDDVRLVEPERVRALPPDAEHHRRALDRLVTADDDRSMCDARIGQALATDEPEDAERRQADRGDREPRPVPSPEPFQHEEVHRPDEHGVTDDRAEQPWQFGNAAVPGIRGGLRETLVG